MTQDDIIISRIEDKLEQCSSGYYITNTGFLDSHEQALAASAVRRTAGVKAVFYGGYSDAERRILVCIPSDWPVDAGNGDGSETADSPLYGLLSVLRVSAPASSKLSHRDYLGALLGLGLDRNISGDILVRDDGADIIIISSIADFLIKEFAHVGRYDVKAELADISELRLPELRFEIIRDTVPSLRLDNIVSSAFKISRKSAVQAINSGLVSVNHIEAAKADSRIDEGSSLVLRGKGKAILTEVGGESKKNRLWITIKRFV